MAAALEHVTLRVKDLDAVRSFYTEGLGLVEIDETDEAVYLGCGVDNRFDIALVEGKTALDHFAIRVTQDEFDEYINRLANEGVATERTDGAQPGQKQGVQFVLPNGARMELVVVDDPRYSQLNETAHPNRNEFTPVDAEHINLSATDLQTNVEFLTDVLDFRLSEVQHGEDGWDMAFTRHGSYHHDVAFTVTDDKSLELHHYAFETSSLDQMKSLLDRLAKMGHEIEVGVSRHIAGNNIFTYLIGEGGHRIELSAEMVELHDDTETLHRDESMLFSAWGGIESPASFQEGT